MQSNNYGVASVDNDYVRREKQHFGNDCLSHLRISAKANVELQVNAIVPVASLQFVFKCRQSGYILWIVLAIAEKHCKALLRYLLRSRADWSN